MKKDEKINSIKTDLDLLKLREKDLIKRAKQIKKMSLELKKDNSKNKKDRAKNIKKITKNNIRAEKSPRFKEEQLILKKIKEFNSNGKPTVCMFSDSFYPLIDGVIGVLNNSALQMMEKCNVVVCVPKHKGKVPQQKYLVIGAGSTYVKFLNYDMAQPSTDIKFNKYMKMLNIDVIHVHSPFFMGMYGAKLAKKRNIPLYATFHSQFKADFENAVPVKSVVKFLMSTIMKVFNACDIVFTMHEASKQNLLSYGYTGKVELLPNGTDHICPTNIQERKEIINKKYNIGKDEPVFLFVGRLVKLKNILFIVDALNILKNEGFKFKMFYVGNGTDEQELRDKIAETNLQNDIILTGKIMDRNELANYYIRADLFLFPSLYDTSSIVQIESACYHTPAVFIKGSTTSCTVTDNVNGFLTENSVKDYANRIKQIMQNKELLKTVSENANNQLYVTWKQICNRLYNDYYFPKEPAKKVNNKK